MILYSEMGWIYIKENIIILKKDKKKILKYLFNINKIEKINKNHIILKKNKVKVWLKDVDISYINNLKNSGVKIEDLAITKISENYKIINWVMNFEDNSVEFYDKDFEITYSDVGSINRYPIKYKIKDIEIVQNKHKIEIKYTKKNSFLIYLIIDDLMNFDNNKIKFSGVQLNWLNEKITNIEKLIDTILKNNYCIIENINVNYYEIDIKYDKIDIKSVI